MWFFFSSAYSFPAPFNFSVLSSPFVSLNFVSLLILLSLLDISLSQGLEVLILPLVMCADSACGKLIPPGACKLTVKVFIRDCFTLWGPLCSQDMLGRVVH